MKVNSPMLVAFMDREFPRHYVSEEGAETYSYMFQNRFKKEVKDMFILVAHDPPESWVDKEEKSTRVRGLFAFNYRSRDNKLPVVHANPILSPKIEANAVFVDINNSANPTENWIYSVADDTLYGHPSVFFVNNQGPFKGDRGDELYSNRLVGVLPVGAKIVSTLIKDDQVVDENTITIDSDLLYD